MKKILVIQALMMISVLTFGQGKKSVHFGLKGGLNIATLKHSGSVFDSRIGLHIGGLAHIHIKKHWAIQPELLYSLQGAEFQSGGTKYKFNLSYINVPLVIQYMILDGLRLQTGPQLGFLLDAERQGGNIELGVSDDFNSVDFSWLLGAGYLFKSGFGVDGRVNFGISDISESNFTKYKNQVVQLGIFYQFGN